MGNYCLHCFNKDDSVIISKDVNMRSTMRKTKKDSLNTRNRKANNYMNCGFCNPEISNDITTITRENKCDYYEEQRRLTRIKTNSGILFTTNQSIDKSIITEDTSKIASYKISKNPSFKKI